MSIDKNVPIEPLADYIVCVNEEAASKTSSGLYLPSTSQEKPTVAKVLAVGEMVRGIKVGEKVIFKSYSNTDVKVGSSSYTLVREEDIMARVV